MYKIGLLPKSLEISGTHHPIRTDYRDILHIFTAFNDDTLTDTEKAEICLRCLFYHPEAIPPEHLEEAVQKAFWFCDGGDAPKSKGDGVRTFDWEHDESILFPAVSKAAGFEVRSCEYLHWWVFLGYFGEVGEGLFSTVLHIRQKIARGKNLDQWEIDFYKRNLDLIELRTAEEQAEMVAAVVAALPVYDGEVADA